jgi:TetR/AcrR family transcriptional regulator, mexJK operon transcriptional repressor
VTDTEPTSERLKARRERFMDAALAAFLERGFERTTLDDIIKRSGGSKATLYTLFADKEDLFFAILRRAAIGIGGDEPAPPLPRNLDELRGLLTSIARRIVEYVLRDDIIGLYRLTVEAALRSPRIGALYYAGGPLKAQGDFAKLLVALDKAGLLSIDDPELAARFFFGMLLDKQHLAMSLGQATAPSKKERERLAAGAVRVFLAAYPKRR